MSLDQKYDGFKFEAVAQDKLDAYVDLFAVCFPKLKASSQYLEWLYFKNPLGNVLGFDAIFQNRVIAHYVCIPTKILGVSKLALLSLNSATHPAFQGKGLFSKLATLTYEEAKILGFSSIIGVANAKSIRPFLKQLEFEYLGNLELRFGVLNRKNFGIRIYSLKELIWRCSSPNGKMQFKLKADGSAIVSTKILSCIKISSVVPLSNLQKTEKNKWFFGFTVDWKKDSKPLIFLPQRLKPSPLALIFKSLDGTSSSVLESWSFPDFDVF